MGERFPQQHFEMPLSPKTPTSLGYNAFACITAAPIVNIAYYPARDFAKAYGVLGAESPLNFALSRWRGMITAPEIPILVSLPPAMTLLTFNAVDHITGSPYLASFLCGVSGGASKQFVRKYSVNIGKRKNFHGEFAYKNPLHCLSAVTAERGMGYWLQGFTAVSVMHALWYGAALHTVKWGLVAHDQRYFFEDAFIALRAMTFWSLVTAPLRNAVNDVTRNAAATERGYIQLGGPHFVKNELTFFVAAMQHMQRTAMSEGIAALFRGSIMAIPKTNVPFALLFATYRLFGGSF